jgi:transcriptional regulator with XRE-family HTH domain
MALGGYAILQLKRYRGGGTMRFFARKIEESKYKRFVRERIKEAREKRDMSQGELGAAIHSTQAHISYIESGRSDTIDAADLMGIAFALQMPITFFYPPSTAIKGVDATELTDAEKELIHFFRQIRNPALENLALRQLKELAEASIEADLHEQKRIVAEERLRRSKPRR